MLNSKSLIALFAMSSLVLSACGTGGTEEVEETPEAPEEEVAVEATVDAPKGFEAYTDPDGVFALAYPSDWDMQEDYFGTSVMFLSPLEGDDAFQDNFSVLSEELPASTIDLAAYEEIVVDQLELFITDFELESSELIRVDGMDAQRLDYSGTEAETKVVWTQVYTIKDDVVYIMTFTGAGEAAAEFDDEVDTMVESFQVL